MNLLKEIIVLSKGVVINEKGKDALADFFPGEGKIFRVVVGKTVHGQKHTICLKTT